MSVPNSPKKVELFESPGHMSGVVAHFSTMLFSSFLDFFFSSDHKYLLFFFSRPPNLGTGVFFFSISNYFRLVYTGKLFYIIFWRFFWPQLASPFVMTPSVVFGSAR